MPDHYGLEAEAYWYVSNNITVSGGLGLLESKSDYTDRELSNTPSFTYQCPHRLRDWKRFFRQSRSCR